MEPYMPPPRLSPLTRVAAAGGLSLAAIEVARRLDQQGQLRHGFGGPLLGAAFDPVFDRYAPVREWAIANSTVALASGAIFLGVFIYAIRKLLVLWRNEVIPRLAGTHFRRERLDFKSRPVDLIAEVARRPAGHCFVGLSPRRRVFGIGWRPRYLTEEQRSAHRHVIGKTGSGKTQSVLWPQVLQDVLDGKGVVYVSGKGSDEEIATIKGIAAVARREDDL